MQPHCSLPEPDIRSHQFIVHNRTICILYMYILCICIYMVTPSDAVFSLFFFDIVDKITEDIKYMSKLYAIM